ncbi:hypothetical protein MC7420_4084 [Coleofasciculus chthonoplastes PCC 7420]|uniref:Ternary complex associated domain-containing protein n=1 Tax=Coleofasciculus chthonoplastes PCC 7420 TaxID=118168 RepID=B4VVE6_9CYAN|nr:lipopolysaccharide kinase InaA family protein [Coleofasciculus chthonoplastes]EDX74099.1 hypothetical protein MC7420_4084 [Coleofasciculus chthonoplastes PCC 7420]
MNQLSPEDLKKHLKIIVGGIKPILYVFDDYNNYVTCENTIWKPKSNVLGKGIGEYYCPQSEDYASSDNQLQEILQGFCLDLNSLSIFCHVKAPPLWIPNTMPSYELIGATLPFAELDGDRAQIAAFLVDFEWKPTLLDYSQGSDQNWTEMGYRAIHLLTQRYPEIPSFLYTGIQNLDLLERGLSSGASWCFYKQKTHHIQPPEPGSFSLENLNYISLERHLAETAKTRYSSYQEVPFPNQFHVEPNTPAGAHLFQQLDLAKPIDRCSRGQALQKLIAELFPTGDQVQPVKVLTSGKSGAQATFFVKPKNQATRFLKIASWLSIQKEYLAYQQIIQPLLNSYTATIIRKPLFSEGNGDQVLIGALMYSLAGFPEDYQKLRSLDSLFQQYLHQPEGGDILMAKIEATLETVLKNLFYCGASESPLQTEQRPLWSWLGEVLPPLSGVLIPLKSVSSEQLDNPQYKMPSYSLSEYNDKVAWILASFELSRQLEHVCSPNCSAWDNQFPKKVLLSGWFLSELECQGDEFTEGSITLTHPNLGLRMRLRGKSQDIKERFSTPWIRPGMAVDVLACLDEKSREVEKIKRKIAQSIWSEMSLKSLSEDETLNHLLNTFSEVSGKQLANPFDWLGNRPLLPYHYTIAGHSGSIHGDLNLQNILFAGEKEQVGWLIDFERSQKQGMVAFDLAKLEVQIWNHHLTPCLTQLATTLESPDTSKPQICYHLLDLALKATDFEDYSAELFQTQLKLNDLLLSASDLLLIPIANTIKLIACIRGFAMKQCQLTPIELSWARAVYCLNSAKYPNLSSWYCILAFLASAWHLDAVHPELNCEYYSFDRIKQCPKASTHKQQIDGFLVKLERHHESLNYR